MAEKSFYDPQAQDLKQFQSYLPKELTPDAESNQSVGNFTALMAGLASGVLKVPQGIASLGAELIDLGFDTNAAASVEQVFHKLNVFEPIAEERLIGRLAEGLIQIGVPSTIGAKVATKLATKAIQARKAGTYLDLTATNLTKGIAKAEELNKLSNTQRFAAIAVGGAAGDTMVADIEKLGTIGTAFGVGPTQLDTYDTETSSEDAAKKLMNRFKFGSESLLVTPFVYGAGYGIKRLATMGEQLAYSDSKLDRLFFKIGSVFTPEGSRPRSQYLSKELEEGARKSDANLAMEQVARIDKEINSIFPETNKFFNAASNPEKNQFLQTLDTALYSGKIGEEIDKSIADNIIDTMTKRGAKPEGINTVLEGMGRIRSHWSDLIKIASKGKGEIPEGLFSDLRSEMGDRLKNIIGNTYEIFENKYATMFTKFEPTRDRVEKVKNIFKRYASRHGEELTDLEAQSMVDNILEQAERMNPKAETLPSFRFGNLSTGAINKDFVEKTFVRTLEKNLAGGAKELEVIGKGSKAFRELFGEINDVRHSIFEGTSRLSVVARKNEMYARIVEDDLVAKAAATAETPIGKKGFFHDSELEAKRALGTNSKIVKMDDYIANDFKGGAMVNALQGKWTTKEVAEGFKNTSFIQDFMRGEKGGVLGETASWLYRNLVLLPKAISQYDKTILSIPTQIKNFLSNGAFALANGTIFESPEIIAQAAKKAGMSAQLGIRQPLSMEQYREYLRLGITESSAIYGDLKNSLKDTRLSADGNIGTDSMLKPLLNSLGKAGEKIKQIGEGAQKLYIASDDVFKIYNFEVEVARRGRAYANAGIKKTEEELKLECAEIVKNTVPNYGRVGEFIKLSRYSPIGNFMSFPSEIFRTGTGIAQQILRDLKDPITGSLNPFTSTNIMKGQALKRLSGATLTYAVLPYGVVEGSKAIHGVSDEEAKAAADFVSPWSKDSQKIYMRNPDTNELYFVDWSRMNAYDTLQRPFATLLRNLQQGMDKEEPLMKGFIKGIAEAAGNIASPFVDPSIYTEAFLDVTTRGGRTKEGKQLWTPETPTNEKVSRTIGHLSEAFYPTYKPFQRIGKALKEEPGKGGEFYEVPYEVAGIFGLRPEKIDPKKTMGFYVTDFQDGERNSRREFTGGPEGTLSGEIKTPKDLIERYFVANQALFGVQQKMADHLKNAQTLGVSKGELGKLFETRGLSGDIASRLNNGKFEPFFPSDAIIERFNEISRTTGQANPWIGAQGVLQNMRRQFRSQNLFQPLNMDLKNFLPTYDTTPGASAPLNTPMPNPNVFSQSQGGTGAVASNQPLSNGLTPSENAYLSESEKAMRLKQRGLA
jgi:hypothetical protein